MSGSIASIQQFFHAIDSKNPRWNDPRTDGTDKISDLRNREFSAFFKDDWKITPDLTLNLGVRWEYYGVPWENYGMAAGIANGISGAMGVSKGDLSTWMPTPDKLTTDLTALTDQILVGPNSPNPDQSVHGKDFNNFAPHVGFSWQLPWFGKSMTTLRGGYSISYVRTTNFDQAFGYASITYQPTMVYSRIYNTFTNGCTSSLGGAATGCYLDLTTAGKLLPLYTESKGWVGMEQQPEPLQQQWVGKRDATIQMYDPDIVNPYVQNLNMSLTRQVGRALTVDVRYIATLSRKTVPPQSYGLNLNTNNLVNSGLLNELVTLRRDGPTTMGSPEYDNRSKYPILDRYILPGTYMAGATNTGSQQVWSMQSAANLAQGNVNAIVTAISNANCAAGTVGVTCQMESGRNQGNVLKTGDAPDNLIIANPQYVGVNVFRNGGTSNYHSMQAQLTMRPLHGLNFQATYTWSRNLTRAGTPVDYNDWLAYTYDLSGQHRSHVLAFHGSYTLPFGHNGLVLRNTSGVLKKAVEGWNVSWMGRVSSGAPMSLAASANSLWSSTRFDQVGPFDPKQGKVEWDQEHNYGYYMGKNKYVRVVDPQCLDETLVHPNLRNSCGNSLRALIEVDPNGSYNDGTVTGNLIFVNPKPGTTGNVRPNSFTGPGSWSLDANMGKTINFMDGKSLEIRVDAQNVFNHATPSNTAGNSGARDVYPTNPPLTINTTSPTPFGQINTKAGRRTFQARLRLSF